MSMCIVWPDVWAGQRERGRTSATRNWNRWYHDSRAMHFTWIAFFTDARCADPMSLSARIAASVATVNTSKRRNRMRNRPAGVDLFSGVGGMSLGFEQAGFDVIAAVD